jgi:putative membrane protein
MMRRRGPLAHGDRVASRLLWAWIANAVALLVAVLMVADLERDGFGSIVVAGAILGVVNTLVRPVVRLLALPAILLTLGLVLLVIDIGLFWLTVALAPGLDVDGFGAVIAGGLIVWAANLVLHAAIGRRRSEDIGGRQTRPAP